MALRNSFCSLSSHPIRTSTPVFVPISHASSRAKWGRAGPSAPAAAPAPAQPRNRTAAAPRAAAGPAQRPAAARTLDHASAAELICLAFPLRDDGGGGRWTVLTADQAALQLRQTVAFWLLSNPELSELGPRRATVSALSKHLTKRHKGVWRNPAYGFPSLHDFLQSPDSHGVFALYAHGSPGEPVVELDAVALRRAVVAGSGQHPENGLAAGAEGTAGARAQERGRQRGSTQAAAAEGAAAAGNGAAGTAHNSGSDCGTGKRSSIGKRRSSSPTGAAGISTAAGALNAPLVGAGAGAGAAAGARAGADGRAAGAAAASAPLEESTAALVRAAFPLQLVGNTPAPDQPARQLRQAIATWLAGNPYASELGPRRASLRSLGIYLREVCTDLWRNRAHRFPKIVEFLRSPHSRGVFLLFEKGRDTPHLHVELDIVALLHAAAAEAAEMGLVEGADSQNGGDGATAVTVGAGREPAAGAAATAAEAPAPAGAPAATPVGNELEAPAARAVPVRPLQLLQHLQQPHASLPVVAGSVPPEPAQLGPSPVGPALAGAAEPAAMNGAAASGDPSLPRLLVPVPVSQPEPDCGATPLAPPATAQPQPQSLSSVPAPATWVPVSVHAGAGFSARSAGTDGMSEEAAPAVAVDQVGVAAPDAALGSVYQAGPEALEPAAARGYVQPQQAALDEPAQQPLPEAGVCVVNDPYGEELIAMLQHCGCCTRIGLAVQVHGGRPALVSVYAPLALMKVNGADGLLVRWPAAVYLVDPLAAAASYGGGAEGEVAAAALLCSLQPLLEASSISKVIYGGGSALACLEEAIAVGSGDMFAVVRTHPLHNLRVVLKGVQLMLEVPLEPPSMPTPAGPIVPHGGVAAYLPVAASGGGGVSWLRGLHAHVARLRDALAGTGLWADRPQLLAVLASRHAAALREDAQLEDGSAGPDEDAAARVLTRPLAPSQLEAAARAARHLPELWAALVQEAVPWVAAHASTSDMAVHRNLAV